MQILDVADGYVFSLTPLTLSCCLAGNDVEYNIRRELGLVRDPKTQIVGPNRPERYTELGDDLVVKLGRLGQKAGKVNNIN